MTIKEIVSKIKKLWEKPTIERVAIFTQERAYLGMSKQMSAMHEERKRQDRCMRRCIDDRRS